MIIYNQRYDRISNLGRQRCYCGSHLCAKYIGAKKQTLPEETNSDAYDVDENKQFNNTKTNKKNKKNKNHNNKTSIPSRAVCFLINILFFLYYCCIIYMLQFH